MSWHLLSPSGRSWLLKETDGAGNYTDEAHARSIGSALGFDLIGHVPDNQCHAECSAPHHDVDPL